MAFDRLDSFMYTVPTSRVTNITPFTYRDGMTYLELLERIRQWVNGGLVDEMDTEFSELTKKHNDAVRAVIDDANKIIATGRNAFNEFLPLPDEFREKIAQMDRDYSEKFRLFADSVRTNLERDLTGRDFTTFSWFTGEYQAFSEILHDAHNFYLPHGLTAGDLHNTITVDEIDNTVYNVREFETRGKEIFDAVNPHMRYSPVDGQIKTAFEMIAEIWNHIMPDGDSIETKTAEQLSTAVKEIELQTVGE